ALEAFFGLRTSSSSSSSYSSSASGGRAGGLAAAAGRGAAGLGPGPLAVTAPVWKLGGSGGGLLAGFLTAPSPVPWGTWTEAPHPGHFTVAPALASATFSDLSHSGQGKRIMVWASHVGQRRNPLLVSASRYCCRKGAILQGPRADWPRRLPVLIFLPQ